MSPDRALIIKKGSLAGVLLATPVIRAVKAKWTKVCIDFATTEKGAELLEYHPDINQFILGEEQSKESAYDLIIDLESDQLTKHVKKNVGAKVFKVDSLNWQKSLLVNLKINLLPNKHQVDGVFQALEPLDLDLDFGGLDYFIADKYEVETDWLPESHREEYIVFAIGGDHATRKMPLEKLIETCDRINKPIILIGGKEDDKEGTQIASFFEKRQKNSTFEKGLKKLNKKACIFNACGKFGIHQFASIIKNARAVFTHDNHWMQVAAAFEKEVFVIWGNTIPEFGAYPYLTKFTTFENTKLGCRPCSVNGYDKCPLGHFKCMKTQNLDFYIP